MLSKKIVLRKGIAEVFFCLLTACLAPGLSASAWAQKNQYTSPADADISIKTLVLCPIVDNTKNIYGEPLTLELKKNLESWQRWRIVECTDKQKSSLEDFEENPALVQKLFKATEAQALLTGRLSKGTLGVTLRMGFFVGTAGLPWAVDSATLAETFELDQVKHQLRLSVSKITKQLPYEAQVLSRRGNLVTLDRGWNAGLKVGDELEVIQILSIQRHPKLKFMVGVEKTIMGKVKIQKVDESLAFGSIISERSDGLVAVGYKAARINFVELPETPLTADGRLQEALGDRSDRGVSIGDQPSEWLPRSEEAPGFGALSLLFGFGSYTASNTLATSGGVSATKNLNPSIHLAAEAWITANWIARLNLLQNVGDLSNDLSGSTPGKLNLQTRELGLAGGYRLWFGEALSSANVEVSFGMNQMTAQVDDSAPTSLTSVSFGGLVLGFAGSFPVEMAEGKPILVGGRFNYVMNASLSESPVTSGSSSNAQISQFALTTKIPWKPRLNWVGELRFHQYGATLTGTGTRPEAASSLSHASTAVAAGIDFLF